MQAINLIFEGLQQYDDDQLRDRVAAIRGEIRTRCVNCGKLEELEHRFREESEESERNRIDNRIDETRKTTQGPPTKATLDDYLPEVFALVRYLPPHRGAGIWCAGICGSGTWCPLTFS